MCLRPVGVIRNRIEEPSLVVDSGDLKWRGKVETLREERRVISELVIDSDLAGILDGVESYSHLLILYWAHRVPPEGRFLTQVHPMGKKDFPLVGIFATASPARPNPICVTPVRLLERRANILRVEGLDAVDGSPLVDIKPYVPSFYAATDVTVADWMMQVVSEFYE
jgi:tRNA-Thr(GGU) m(6)t(6)A37 methyltransferase TsaA